MRCGIVDAAVFIGKAALPQRLSALKQKLADIFCRITNACDRQFRTGLQ
jgi:hypothetical protein